MTETTDHVKKEDLIVTRIIDAPLELVWRAWTDPEHVKRWWGPKDYTSPTCKIDLRVGGKYVFCMRAPKEQGGQDTYSAGVYRKIVPMERLEFSQNIADKDGNKIDPTQIGMPPDFPKEMHMVIVFKAKGDMTELTIRVENAPVGQMFVYALAGWHQSMDKLAESLAKT
jgi:uncharacterized protein YndB with AHSA1/START domain